MSGPAGLIGPNAILQLLPAIEKRQGAEAVHRMLARAGIEAVPDGTAMIPESDAARLFRQLRIEMPDRAGEIATEAGRRTADYILANRIPAPAQSVLKWLPPGLAARGLSRAISRNAWTFAGSGQFRAITPWLFEIADNPLIRGEAGTAPLCVWHAAVFERLYRVLVAPEVVCTEVRCAAVTGEGICRFALCRSAAEIVTPRRMAPSRAGA
ncbi:bacteriochlorophyll 4-vinyl reductase [Jiella marina]|uniref:bacteriochlorophyll 4-vinyl reductase n=1 Tax=Jiella sp. LLJ827 TaxID=2917712 RepID=UPI002100D87E|nr:bacteriochlorophyll 4-vinyl reductase [Jiella sp. LLJ827]MCQ0987917.1 bacteriochlorophyll 4-vinyl reductase [Jiella sp. LLJ827]